MMPYETQIRHSSDERLLVYRLGGAPNEWRGQFVWWDHDYLNFGGRAPNSITAWTMKDMIDRVSRDQGGMCPLHIELALRANGRLEIFKRSFDAVQHPSPFF